MSERILSNVYLISLTNKCNLNCEICTLKNISEPSLERILTLISKLEPDTEIILSGGEPFLRKDLFSVLKEANRFKLKVGISTNGRILIYNELILKLTQYVKSFIISPFIVDEAVYYQITKSREGYNQSIDGIKRILVTDKLSLELIYPLNSKTINYLDKILAFFKSIKIKSNTKLIFIFYLDLKKQEIDNLLEQMPNQYSTLDNINKIVPVYFKDIPLCLLNNYPHIESNKYIELISNNSICPLIKYKARKRKTLICSECIQDVHCSGIQDIFSERIITKYFHPEKGVKSNSFDYVKIKDIHEIESPSKECRIYINHRFDNPQRYLFLKKDKDLSLYYTDTDSFSDTDILRIKIEKQQIYLDKSNKIILDDFQRDIRQLRLYHICEMCPQLRNCAAVFTISNELPFKREERWLKQEIRRLSGRVLDIGCGDMRYYKDIINKLLNNNTIEYFGVDIDQKALNRLKKEVPKAKLMRTTIEDFQYQKEYFDYIFSLRSLNHFYSINKAFDNIVHLMRNGGMLIIAECVPFALLRDQEKILEVRKSMRPVFEHYRNWSSEELIDFVRRFKYPFKIDTHKPVQGGTSNQWIIKFMKIDLR